MSALICAIFGAFIFGALGVAIFATYPMKNGYKILLIAIFASVGLVGGILGIAL